MNEAKGITNRNFNTRFKEHRKDFRYAENVVITTKGLQDRNKLLLDGRTMENKGKLISHRWKTWYLKVLKRWKTFHKLWSKLLLRSRGWQEANAPSDYGQRNKGTVNCQLLNECLKQLDIKSDLIGLHVLEYFSFH